MGSSRVTDPGGWVLSQRYSGATLPGPITGASSRGVTLNSAEITTSTIASSTALATGYLRGNAVVTRYKKPSPASTAIPNSTANPKRAGTRNELSPGTKTRRGANGKGIRLGRR